MVNKKHKKSGSIATKKVAGNVNNIRFNKKYLWGILALVIVLFLAVILKTGGNMANIVVLETSKGNIEVELNQELAPVTVENFIKYVEEKHFDGTVFHRVMPGFMVQGGGFTSEAIQKSTHDPIMLESSNGLKNTRGTIAMARTNDPNSATAQFFINLVDNDFLDHSSANPGYAVFGNVKIGMDVVDEIATVTTSTRGMHQNWPVEDIVITRAYMK